MATEKVLAAAAGGLLETPHLQGALRRTFVPPLTRDLHKGSCGRVAVIGGSEDYSGAPFLSAMGALRCGCDLAYVLCPPAAAIPIKSYSPELVVRPILDPLRKEELFKVLPNCHVAVVGPGLGLAPEAQALAKEVIERVTAFGIPLVIDADGLRIVESDPTLFKRGKGGGKQGAGGEEVTTGGVGVPVATPDTTIGTTLAAPIVITPNANELRRLLAATNIPASKDSDEGFCSLRELSNTLGCSVFAKGSSDEIAVPAAGLGGTAQTDDIRTWQRVAVAVDGSPRRAAGQGDVLSGILATYLGWVHLAHKNKNLPQPLPNATLDALVTGAWTMRRAQQMTFADPKLGRGYIATDLLAAVPAAFASLHSDDSTTGSHL